MAQFEKLQELWQGQASPAVSAGEIAAMTRSLHAYGRRQRWVIGGKVLLICAILGWSLARVHRPNQVAGLLVVAAAAGVVLTLEWRGQRRIAQLDFTAPSLGFVNGAIDRLRAQVNPFRRVYWPFVAAIVLGMNLMLGSARHIGWRLFASALPFGAVEFGLWIRRKRLTAECRPLLNQLAAMQAAIEEYPE
jgi:hypothetical protein